MAFGTDKKFDAGYNPAESSSRSYFGKSMRIEGEITSDEDLTIEGKVKGQLEVSKTLTIGKEGYVNGRISASVVHISGEAEGHLHAKQKLEISADGKYTGNITSDTIRIAEGAKIRGTINTDEEIPAKAETQEQPLETAPGMAITNVTDTVPADESAEEGETTATLEPTEPAETTTAAETEDTEELKESTGESAEDGELHQEEELKEIPDSPDPQDTSEFPKTEEPSHTEKKSFGAKKAKR